MSNLLIKSVRALLLIVLALPGITLITRQAVAYEIEEDGVRWPGATTVLYTAIPGVSPSGIFWRDAYEQAASEWEANSPFRFVLQPQYLDPCRGVQSGLPDYLNGAGFHTDICGREISDTTLAVTAYYYENNLFGSADISEADIIFNENLQFDIYDGPLRQNSRGNIYDFRRVALHELGHVIGLGHETDLPAIMAPNIGDEDHLLADDIAGARALYNGTDNCPNSSLYFGRKQGELNTDSCTIQQLIGGGNDDSNVDVYTLDVTVSMSVSLDLKPGNELAPVMILANEQLDILAVDDGSAAGCQPQIRQQLDPGRYVVLINTYSNTTSLPCGETRHGPYQLETKFLAEDIPELPGTVSLLGGQADAEFYGGVAREGESGYVNSVTADDFFTVETRIEPDPRHVGESGFVVAVVQMGNGEWLAKNQAGNFEPFQPGIDEIPVMATGLLLEQIDVNVLDNFRASSIGVTDDDVDFLFGYGLSTMPGELFFTEKPLNLLIFPE